MKVLVCGGRDYANRYSVELALASFTPSMVIEGGCPTGADAYARTWAREKGVGLLTVPADWKAHGKAAGPLRNQKMLEHGAPDVVLAFPGGRGTADMVRRATKAGVKVHQFE